MQCGGWTVRWQGFEGNDFWKDSNKQSSNASSILDALKTIQAKNNVKYLLFSSLLYIQIILLLLMKFKYSLKEGSLLNSSKI